MSGQDTEPLMIESEKIKEHQKRQRQICIMAVLVIIMIIAAIIIGISALEISKNNSNNAESELNGLPPKNLIVIIGDGMGNTYNGAYRRWKGLNKTILDDHFKGRYHTVSSNKFSIVDSASGANVFSNGFESFNGQLGVNKYGNPKGSILGGAKRQGKGTGIVVTKSVTDATPAAFTSHSFIRSWNELISKQQATRMIDGKPMIDVLFGGGRRYFERWNFMNNKTLQEELGWKTVIGNATEFNRREFTGDDLPIMAVMSDGSFPYYLDRLTDEDPNNEIKSHTDLLDMSKIAIDVLDDKFHDEGFFLMIEGSEIDLCGHNNDIVCLLWEMEEFMQTVEYVLNWAENDGDTLVVLMSDHETGGLTLGADASWLYSYHNIIRYFDGSMPENWETEGITKIWAEFTNNLRFAPPPENTGSISEITHSGIYKWIPLNIENSLHTASYISSALPNINGNVTDVMNYIYDNYMGNGPPLSDSEKRLIERDYLRSSSTRREMIVSLMNARTLSGWTTRGHSGADCSVYAFGPYQDKFNGHFISWEIGRLMIDIFGVRDEVEQETSYLEDLFVNGDLKLCDETYFVNYTEWETSVIYPPGNLLEGQFCVQQWT